MLCEKVGKASVMATLVRFSLLATAVALQAIPFAMLWGTLALNAWATFECQSMLHQFAGLRPGISAEEIKQRHGAPTYISNTYRYEGNERLSLLDAEWIYMCSDTPIFVFLDGAQRLTREPPLRVLPRRLDGQVRLVVLHIVYLVGLWLAILLFAGNKAYITVQSLALLAMLCLDMLVVSIVLFPLSVWTLRAHWLLVVSAVLGYGAVFQWMWFRLGRRKEGQ